MKNIEMDKQILEILTKNPEKYYSAKELASLIPVRKHEYSQLTHTLIALNKDGQIERSGRGFRLSRVSPTVKPVPAPTPKDKQPTTKTPDQRTRRDTVIGKFDASPLARNKSFAFVLLPEGDVYVSSEDVTDAFHGDMVEVKVMSRRNQKMYGRIVRVVERARTEIIGNLYRHDRQVYLAPSDMRIHREFLVTGKDMLQPGYKAVLKVDNWGSFEQHRLPSGHVTELLGEAGEPDVEVLGVIRQYDLPMEFPEEVLKEADALSDDLSPTEIKRRRDLRDRITFTVDPVSAKDYDDAITLETTKDGWKLFVHIADVSHYVRANSALFREAVNRGNSYYFPRRVLPMLPERISNRLCSLRPDEDKLVMTVETDFDAQGKILRQSLHEAVIRSNARLAYEQVDDLFAGKPTEIPTEVIPILLQARKLSNILTKQRVQKGCLFFNMPEVEYIFDDEGYVTNLDRSVDTESHTLIENFMLIANEYTALSLMKSRKAGMYRIHEDPDMEKITTLLELISLYGYNVKLQKDPNKLLQKLLVDIKEPVFHRVFDRIILRAMKKARYDVKPIGHFGLAMKNYTHFTSPIRRLCDLLVHHMLKARVLKTPADDFPPERLEDLARISSEKELLADSSEREVNRVNVLAFMRKHLGEVYTSVVSGVSRSGLHVELDDLPVYGSIPVENLPRDNYWFDDKHLRLVAKRGGREFKLMQKLRVQVVSVVDEVEFRPLKDKA
jgi:ribonuclease R